MKKLILIDGNAILHRAFHALPPFRTSKGELVNAVYGFASMLFNLLEQQKPDYLVVSFDTKAKTFRHEDYEEYKAHRVKAPEGLYEQLPLIKKLVETFQIPIFEKDGFEADDVLGVLSRQAFEHGGVETYIVTGDMDTLQLINEHTRVLTPHKGFKESIVYDTQKVLGKYGLKPSQIPDLKGLQGDSSDNIKGVAGIGQKTATMLLQKFGSIENIYEQLETIEEKYRKKLEAGEEDAFKSKKLATILTEIDGLSLDLETCKTHDYDHQKLLELFEELEFKSLSKKLQNFDRHYSAIKESENKSQPSLF